jgi:hypothetical protein
MSARLLLRLWILLTVLVIGGAFVWEVAPVLIPMAAVAAGFGGAAFLMIVLARWLERRRNNSAPRG